MTTSTAWADEQLELSGTVYTHELSNNVKIKIKSGYSLVLIVDEDKIIDYIKGDDAFIDVVMYKDLALGWVECGSMRFYGTGDGGQHLTISNTSNHHALYAKIQYIWLEDLNVSIYNRSGDKSALRAECDSNNPNGANIEISNCNVNCSYTDGDAMILINDNGNAGHNSCVIYNSTINMSDAIPYYKKFIYQPNPNYGIEGNQSEIRLINVSGNVNEIYSNYTANSTRHHGKVTITGTGDLNVDRIVGSTVSIDNEKLYVGCHDEVADWNGLHYDVSHWYDNSITNCATCISAMNLYIDMVGSYTFLGPFNIFQNKILEKDKWFTNLDKNCQISGNYSVRPADELIKVYTGDSFSRVAAINYANPSATWYLNKKTVAEYLEENQEFGSPKLNKSRVYVGSTVSLTRYPFFQNVGGDETYAWYVNDQLVEGETGPEYTARPEDYGKNIQCVVSLDKIIGSAYSNMCYVDKYDNNNSPTAPKAIAAKSGTRVKGYITNAEAEQEYFISYVKDSPDRLTDSDWRNAVSPDADGRFEITDYCNPDQVNYIYTRYKEDDTHKAGVVIKSTELYFGSANTAAMNDFAMTVTGVDTEITDDWNGSYDVPLNGVVKVSLSPVPANAIDANDFQGAKFALVDLLTLTYSDCGTYYADEACTTPINADTYYKEVYLKCTKPGNGVWISAACANPSKTHSVQLYIKDEDGMIYPDNIVCDESLGVVIERPSTSDWSRTVGFTVYPANASLDNLTIDWASEVAGVVRPTLQVQPSDRSVLLGYPGEPLSLGTWYAYFKNNGERITYLGSTSSMKVTVIPVQPREIYFSLDEVTVDPGDSFNLSDFITVNPYDAEYELTYSIEGGNGITVDAAGVVTVDDDDSVYGETAVVTITATGSDNSATTTVTVKVSGEKYGFTVKGVEVNSNNMNDILGDGKVSYDPSTNTLTLAGINESYDGAAFVNSSGADDLIIKVVGENNITMTNSSSMAIGGNNIIVTGSGSLNINADAGIYTNRGEVEIKGGVKVNLTGSYGIMSNPLYQSGTGFMSTGSLVLSDMAELNINASQYPVWLESLTMGDGFVIVSPEDGSFETVDAGSGIMVGTIVDNEYNIAANQTVVIKNVDALRGDADLSGDVDVADITHVNNYILLRRDYVNSFLNADIDASTQLDIVDVTGIANISLSAEASSAPVMSSRIAPRNKADYSLFEDYLSANDMSLKAGEHKSLLIELNSSIDYTAFQMDITLPEGVKISKAQLGDRVGRSHVLAMRDNGAFTRLMSYSSKNSSIEAGQGTILMLDLEAEDSFFNEGKIWFDNIRFVPTDGEKVFLPAFNVMLGTTTGIDKVDVNPSGVSVSNGVLTINGANGGVATITSMNGVTRTVTLDSGVNQVELDHGVYIVTVNGQSVKVRL